MFESIFQFYLNSITNVVAWKFLLGCGIGFPD